jgi:hypothetical protein
MFSGFGLVSKKQQKIGFQDVQHAIKTTSPSYLLINTLPAETQQCLIQHTLPLHDEEKTINGLIDRFQYKEKTIILYGKHATDVSVDQKYDQLVGLGFSKVYVYSGGLFEWLLLQDVYGYDEFPTTKKILDPLEFKPDKCFFDGSR